MSEVSERKKENGLIKSQIKTLFVVGKHNWHVRRETENGWINGKFKQQIKETVQWILEITQYSSSYRISDKYIRL